MMSSGWSDPHRNRMDQKSTGIQNQNALIPSGLEGMDAVVHLAGENVGSGRWTRAKKARIFDSRVKGTRLLCESLANLNTPPAGTDMRIGYRLLRQTVATEVMNEGSAYRGFGFLGGGVQRVGDSQPNS